MDELLKQEILELTELLREDEEWKDLRKILLEKGFNLSEIALVSFTEDEEENEYGVIVTKNQKVLKYSRSTKSGMMIADKFLLVDITNVKEDMEKYPQIGIAFDMMRNGL